MKVTCVIILVYACHIYFNDREKEQAWSSRIIITELFISLSVAILLSMVVSKAYADFVMCQILITRIVSTCYILIQIGE